MINHWICSADFKVCKYRHSEANGVSGLNMLDGIAAESPASNSERLSFKEFLPE